MKTKQAHTPGPWHVEGDYVANPRSYYVAKLSRHGSPSEAELEANASLIASAPELLEACKATFEALPPIYQLGGVMEKVKVKLEQAIAKAEGRA